MTYQPVIPFGGLAGWSFLSRTRENQQEAFNNSALIQRDTEYFKENIGDVLTAEQLVADRRLLSVALGAFGLDADIDNKFFIKKILQDGTLEPDTLANRLSDKRYLALSKAFGFGDFDPPNTQLSDFPETMTGDFRNIQFEIAVGNQDANMRLAMGFERELATVLEEGESDAAKWFYMMGTLPLRKVFETALGLPASVGLLDLDLQLKTFREKAERFFGSSEIEQFAEPENQKRLVDLFLLRSEIDAGGGGMSPGAAALILLQNITA